MKCLNISNGKHVRCMARGVSGGGGLKKRLWNLLEITKRGPFDAVSQTNAVKNKRCHPF